MTKKTIFSIIIPTYNRAKFIGGAIQTVLNQSFQQFELIIIDDGSTDNTEEVVNSYTDQRIVYHKKANAERGAARNSGTRLASGEYVSFFDSDDLLYTNHLQEALHSIEIFQKPEIFHLGYDVKTPQGKILREINSLKGQIGSKLVTGNFLSCNGVFIRRDIASTMPFNEDRRLSAFEDWQLWLRMSSRYEIHYRNVITSTVINHPERSVLTTQKEALIDRGNLLIKTLRNDEVFYSFYKKKFKVLQANVFTYISLHLAMTKKYRKDAIVYLLKGIALNPREGLKRRCFAILKNLI